MKIAFFEAHPFDKAQGKGEEELLREALPNEEVFVTPDSLEAGKISDEAREAEVISIFVDSRVDKEVLEKLPKLKLIATRSTGYDHIDLVACKAKGILVSNVPTYGEHTVAEHTFALILALSRKIFQSYERTERRKFSREGLQGFDLFGKTLGVVGTGNIGRNVVKCGLGLGMKVVAHDVHPNQTFGQEAGKLGDFQYVGSLEKLLPASEVVTLHVPYMKETHHLINKQNIALIKRGALLINTARGGLVETEAMLWGLGEGILAGAGLDVLEEEGDMFDDLKVWSRGIPEGKDIRTLLQNHILIARDDVILTPHNAFNSKEAVRAIFDTTVGNIKAFIDGQPGNVVGK